MDNHDPYRTCEDHCNHDLARGVTMGELLGWDGPYPQAPVLVNLGWSRAALFSDEEEPMAAPAASHAG